MSETPTKRKKHTLLKWFLSIGLIIFLLLASAAFYLSIKWKPLLTEAIQNTVIDASDSLYHIKFSNIKINALTGSAFLDSIVIYPDTLIYNKMIKKRIAPENIFELKVRSLALKYVSPVKVYFNRDLDIGAIKIEEPELEVTYRRLKNKIKEKEDLRTTYKKIKGILHSAKLSSLLLNSVKFKYIDRSFKEPKIFDIDQVNIRLNDILIDSASQFDTTRFFHAKDVIAELNNYKYATADSTYFVKLKQLQISTKQKQLFISNLALEPRYPEMKFSNLFPRQHEMYRLNFDSILVSQIVFPQVVDSRNIIAQSLSIKNGSLYAFLNRDKPPKGIDKGKNFPHVLLNKLNWKVAIDTVKLKAIDIAYAEYNPKSGTKGTLTFGNLNGKILNVTNDSLRLLKNGYANAYLNTQFMKRANLNMHIKFDISDQSGRFSYDGNMGTLPLEIINPLSKPLAKMLFSSGTVNRIDFAASGDRNGAKGKVTIKYSDLKVKILKKDDEDGSFKRMGLISLLANVLLIESDNPSKNDPVRVSHPSYERPDDASFFNLMWKIIFNGFKETIGITKEKESKMLENAKKMKERSQKREERKIKREQRKEERKEEKND